MKALFFLFALGLAMAVGNELATHSFEEANELYEQGQYADAAEKYQVAVNQGIENPVLFYNYANSLFRQEKLALAILYYEKALKLSPADPDIQSNLKFARAHTVDKHEEPSQNLLTKFLWYLHSGYSLSNALWAFLLLFSSIFVILALRFSPINLIKILSVPLTILISLVLFLWSPSILFRIKEQVSVRYGIVLPGSLEIYSGPGDTYQALLKVHEGTKFEIEEVTGEWAKVKLPDGSGGFVLFSELGKI